MRIQCFATVVLALVIRVAAAPQTAQVPGGRPSTIAEKLREHSVQLDVPSLVKALTNPDPELRSLAAMELAAENAKAAIPAIAAALDAERLPRTGVNIAFSLAQLDDDRGLPALRGFCRRGDMADRLLATQYMLRLDHADCLSTVLEILRSDEYRDKFADALGLIPGFRHLSEKNSQTLFDLTVKRLSGTEPAVRMAASHALTVLGGVAAIPYLRTAIAGEDDPTVRSRMEADLQQLEVEKERYP